MNYNDLVTQLSKELNLPPRVVDKVYKSYWKFIRDSIQGLPLKEDISEEEFQKLRTNFNIPSLGKLSCTYDRVKRVKERYKYIRNLREKND
jgi:hypothetical protein|nr:MAG TPA: Histone family protein DNA-binding protein, Burkholderia ambifaria, Histone family.85A [Crassvirales sp.]